MKKLTILAFCSIMMFGASSCTKDWQCECTDGTDTQILGFYPDTKKSTAKKSCNDIEDAFSSGVTCSVK